MLQHDEGLEGLVGADRVAAVTRLRRLQNLQRKLLLLPSYLGDLCQTSLSELSCET